MGLNPNNDGKIIRLIFPPLTEERRIELTKQVRKDGENAKVAIRQIRRDAMENYKKMKKNSEITEDDLKDAEKDIQELTDGYIEDIDKIVTAKVNEIMEV
jgi:ribosome recycling factor